MRALLFVALAVVATGSFAAKPAWSSGGIWTVTYRTEIKAPLETSGGAITTMKSRVRVRCADGTAAGLEVTLYEDEASNKVFARNRASAVEYLKEPAGSSADLVVKAVCRK